MITIRLAWDSPPLRSNDRQGWRARAPKIREVRQHAAWWATVIRRERGPIDGPVIVTLVWTVTDARRRDTGAGTPTLKAAIDGLVDGGLLLDDRHEVVAEERYRIERGPVPGIRVEIEPVGASHDADSRPDIQRRTNERPAGHQLPTEGTTNG